MKKNELILEREQFINRPIQEVFSFFAEAKNLEKITPPQLNFKILKTSTNTIETNTLIDYRLKLYGVPFQWKTRINDFKPNDMFIDEQLKGPYKKWIHTHSFTERDGGTLIKDKVIYEIPMGGIGKFIMSGIIKNELEKIFNYREQIIADIFKNN